MIQRSMRQRRKASPRRSALRIIRAINQARNPGLDHRSGAHNARLQRHVQGRLRQTVISKMLRRSPQRYNLRVGRGIAIANGAISAARHNPATPHQHRANRNLSGGCGRARLCERFVHELEVSVHEIVGPPLVS